MMRRGHRLTALAAVLAVGALAAIPPAGAYENPARTLAGPSADVIALGGTAMSPDGRTGGVVYEQRAGVRTHVFVAPYLNGRWRPAEQVDAGQLYDSSFPRIAAADGGQLVVTWVQAHGVFSDQLWAARLGAGSSAFDPALVVDPNIGQATVTDPSLAVAPDGSAYVAYVAPHVLFDDNGLPLPPVLSATGTLPLEYRLAKILATSALPYPPLNRRLGALDPLPTGGDAPQVAVDATGDGVVAWQEPDDGGIPRIWARRLYPRSVGSLTQVSPDTFAGAPLPAASAGFSIAMAGDGEGAIAYRQLPIAGSGLAAPRVLMARLLGVRPGGAPAASRTFQAPQLADALGPPSAMPAGPLSLPQVSVSPDGRTAVGYELGSSVQLATGADTIAAAAGLGTASAAATPSAVVGTGGAGIAAWPSTAGGGTVAIQERSVTAAPQDGRASALLPGNVSAVQAAGSAGGDGIVAFQQGSADDGQIGAAVIDAPPASFAVAPAPGWVRRSTATVGWGAATAACGPTDYRVYVDGRLRARTQMTYAHVSAGVPGDGVHEVRVIATDCHGQATSTPLSELPVDGSRPTISLAGVRGQRRTVGVTLRDGPADVASGVDPAASTVNWGDGVITAGARQRHVYARPGHYRVLVIAVDHAGNRRTLGRRIGVGVG